MRSNQYLDSGPDGQIRRTAAFALTCVLALVAHVSLFPWVFALPASPVAELRHMFTDRLWWTGRSDALANLLLFLPVGALGRIVGENTVRGSPKPELRVVGYAFVFALLLQLIQLAIPLRSAAMSDVWWNLAGTMVGLPASSRLRPFIAWLGRLEQLQDRPTLSLAAVWIAAQCWPLMPAHSLRQMGLAVQPLLHHTVLSGTVSVGTALGLACVLWLAGRTGQRSAFAFLVIAMAVTGKLLVNGMQINSSHLIGWIVGMAAGIALRRIPERIGAIVIVTIALGWYAFDALRPGDWQPEPGRFHLLPAFSMAGHENGVLGQPLLWAAFWLGVVMLAARSLGQRLAWTAVAVALLALLFEVAQLWLAGQRAEAAPAVLPVIWWLLWRRSAAPGDSRPASTKALPDRVAN